MIYRVSLKVGYYKRYFDFDNISDASQFAETILEHQTISEDHKNKMLTIGIDIMTPQAIEEIEKEDE